MKQRIESLYNFINEGRWNHDYAGSFGGSSGSFSTYTTNDGTIVFYLNQHEQKWMWKGLWGAAIPGEVPDKYQDAFENGDIRKMSKCAKEIMGN